jgi:ribosomal protein L11 methyltransferase
MGRNENRVRWWQLTVKVPAESAEAVAALLQEWPEVGGVAMEGDVAASPPHPEWGEWFDDSLLTRAKNIVLQVYLPELIPESEIRSRLAAALGAVAEAGLDVSGASDSVSLTLVDESAWDGVWKQDFRPFSVGRRLRIVPRWQTETVEGENSESASGRDSSAHFGESVDSSPASEPIELRLEPGMAFGTGTHETTQLCLEAIEDLVHPGQRVLDIGCGTAILAIAAAKLGAAQVTAIDIDPVAVDVASDNVHDNGVEQVVEVRQGDLLTAVDGDGYDLAVANILRNIIISLVPQAAVKLRRGGLLVTAGYVQSQAASVEEALIQNGLRVVDRRQRGDWVALVAVNER